MVQTKSHEQIPACPMLPIRTRRETDQRERKQRQTAADSVSNPRRLGGDKSRMEIYASISKSISIHPRDSPGRHCPFRLVRSPRLQKDVFLLPLLYGDPTYVHSTSHPLRRMARHPRPGRGTRPESLRHVFWSTYAQPYASRGRVRMLTDSSYRRVGSSAAPYCCRPPQEC